MWMLRKGKPKLIPFIYVLTPFFIVQLFGFTDHNYPLKEFDSSPILVLLVLTWVFDSFAYIIGSKFGKNRIMPKISPKKSWEGFFGGMAFTWSSRPIRWGEQFILLSQDQTEDAIREPNQYL
jgi:CDP-diglyceride synthetase